MELIIVAAESVYLLAQRTLLGLQTPCKRHELPDHGLHVVHVTVRHRLGRHRSSTTPAKALRPLAAHGLRLGGGSGTAHGLRLGGGSGTAHGLRLGGGSGTAHGLRSVMLGWGKHCGLYSPRCVEQVLSRRAFLCRSSPRCKGPLRTSRNTSTPGPRGGAGWKRGGVALG